MLGRRGSFSWVRRLWRLGRHGSFSWVRRHGLCRRRGLRRLGHWLLRGRLTSEIVALIRLVECALVCFSARLGFNVSDFRLCVLVRLVVVFHQVHKRFSIDLIVVESSGICPSAFALHRDFDHGKFRSSEHIGDRLYGVQPVVHERRFRGSHSYIFVEFAHYFLRLDNQHSPFLLRRDLTEIRFRRIRVLAQEEEHDTLLDRRQRFVRPFCEQFL